MCTPHRGLVAALCAIIATSALACGMGDRSREADRVHATVDKAVAAKTLRAKLTISVALDEDLAAGAAEAGLPPMGGRTAAMQAVADIEFGRKRAIVVLPNGVPAAGGPAAGALAAIGGSTAPSPDTASAPTTEAGVVFAGPIAFVKRPAAQEQEVARDWFAFDYRLTADGDARLSPTADGPTLLATLMTTVNPMYLIELLLGVLPGSLKVAARGSDAADPTVTYKGNLSFEKARDADVLDLEDGAKELRARAFALVGVRDDIVPIEVTLGADGTARRMVIELQSRPSFRLAHTITIAADFADYGVTHDLALPPREASVRVDTHGPLVRALLPRD